MARVNLRNTVNPTLSECAIAYSGATRDFPTVTRDDVIAAARARGIPLRDGRVQLNPNGAANGGMADLYFAIAQHKGVMERPEGEAA